MRNKLVIASFVIYTLIIFLPPVLYRYTYPNHGVDTYYHIQRIEAMAEGQMQNLVYWGDYIVGYPLIWLEALTHIPIAISFMWFNFLVLWLIGVSLYLLLTVMFTKSVSLIALLWMFVSTSVWNLFDTGAVYDLMTIGIILPLLLVCGIKMVHKKWVYIPFTAGLLFLGVTLHSVGIVGVLAGVAEGVIPSEPTLSLLSLIAIMGIPILLLSVFTMGMVKWREIMSIKKDVVLVLIVLLGLVLTFLPLSLYNITGFSVRFGINLAIVMSILALCLIGLCLSIKKDKILNAVVVIACFIAGIPVLMTYYGLK